MDSIYLLDERMIIIDSFSITFFPLRASKDGAPSGPSLQTSLFQEERDFDGEEEAEEGEEQDQQHPNPPRNNQTNIK